MNVIKIAAMASFLFGCFPAASIPDASPSDRQAEETSRKPIVTYTNNYGDESTTPSGDDGRAANFAYNNEQALMSVAQGQGGRYGVVQSFDKTVRCDLLMTDADSKVQSCATELLAGRCARSGSTFNTTECPGCDTLNQADLKLTENGCRDRPHFPTLRAE